MAETIESFAPVRLPTQRRRIIYDEVDATLAYFGAAAPGASTSDPRWMIQRFSYGPGNSLSVVFADSNVEFDNVWDDRASLQYG